MKFNIKKNYLDKLYKVPTKFNMQEFYNDIYPLTKYSKKFNSYEAMQALLHYCIDTPIVWRDRSKFGKNKMPVYWPKDINNTHLANCVDLSFLADFFCRQKYITRTIIAFSIYSNATTARLDHFSLLFVDRYGGSNTFYYWNYYETGLGFIPKGFDNQYIAIQSLVDVYLNQTYSVRNGYFYIPDPIVDFCTFELSDIRYLATKLDTT